MNKNNQMNMYTFVSAFKITIPVLFGYLAIGISFGLLLVNAGYPWYLAFIMSIFMYAGAGQYIAIALFGASASLNSILFTMLIVNIRHIVYGLSLITPLKEMGKRKIYVIFALTDETYSLLTSCAVPDHVSSSAFYTTIAALDQLYWVIGSIIGALAGSLIPFSFAGVDFALTALFTVLLIDQIRKTKDFIPPLIGCACAIIALIVCGPQNMLIAGLCAGIAVLMISRGGVRHNKKQEKSHE